MTRLRAGSATDVGLVRNINQDQYLEADPLYAIADGMGGHAAGEVASQTALDALAAAFERAAANGRDPAGGQANANNGKAKASTTGATSADAGKKDDDATHPLKGGSGHDPDALREAVEAANRAVWDAAESQPELRGMGTTLTGLALVTGSGGAGQQVAVVNVGDSRTYRLRADHFEQVTTDHSVVAELVAEGQIREEEAETHPQRHVLTRALGVYPDVDVDLLLAEPVVGDRYLLCSDGLIREVTDNQVAAVLRRLADPREAARELVAQAKQHGGNDNITVVVVDVVADDSPDAVVDDDRTGVVPRMTTGGTTRPEPAADVLIPADAARAEVAPPTLSRKERKAQKKAAKAARPRMRLITVRVVAFFVLIVAVLGAAYAGSDWYAHNTYYVGLQGNQINIYKGRPGGMLWWQPVLVDRTGVTTHDVLADSVPTLQQNVLEPTLTDARQYITNLKNQKIADTPAGAGVSSTTTTKAKS